MYIHNKNRTWAEINLANLVFNFNNIKEYVHEFAPQAKLISVVKADAYGHGAVEAAKVLSEAGTDLFAVATAAEALELRGAGMEQPILILGYVSPEEIPSMIENNISVTLCSGEEAELFSEQAQKAGGELSVHIAVNTGMTRVGFESDGTKENIDAVMEAVSLPGIRPDGIFTHFAAADIMDGMAYTHDQYIRFVTVVEALTDRGLILTYRHCANSGAILQYPEVFAQKVPKNMPVFNAVRPGIILYGYYPDEECDRPIELRPVMTVKARVVQVRDIQPGTTVGYGRTFTAEKPMTLAVVTMGYADGYHRAASGKAHVLVQGQSVPVVGRICMDMCMADITGLDVKIGDEVIIFGEEGVTADDVAEAAGTISYEVTCAIGRRIPRFYVK